MDAIADTLAAMSPYASRALRAYHEGDDSTATLHRARHEVASWTDRMVGRRRRGRGTALRLITAGREAYDTIAAELYARGEL